MRSIWGILYEESPHYKLDIHWSAKYRYNSTPIHGSYVTSMHSSVKLLH